MSGRQVHRELQVGTHPSRAGSGHVVAFVFCVSVLTPDGVNLPTDFDGLKGAWGARDTGVSQFELDRRLRFTSLLVELRLPDMEV